MSHILANHTGQVPSVRLKPAMLFAIQEYKMYQTCSTVTEEYKSTQKHLHPVNKKRINECASNLPNPLTPYRQAPIETQLRHSSQAHSENYLQTKRPSAHKGCERGRAGEVGGGASRDQASSPKPNTDGYWSASGIRAGSFQQPALMLREMGRTNKASTAKANPGRLLISGPNHSLIHLRGGVWRMSTLLSPVCSFLSCLLKKIGTCRRGQLGCNNVMELHMVVQYNPQWCFINASNNARHNLNRQFESPREIKTFPRASKVTHW